jgi:hypothetical protein
MCSVQNGILFIVGSIILSTYHFLVVTLYYGELICLFGSSLFFFTPILWQSTVGRCLL